MKAGKILAGVIVAIGVVAFLSIYNEYKNAKSVTQERMYLETMEKVLADIDKVIIEKNAGSGVVPYLPLPELQKLDFYQKGEIQKSLRIHTLILLARLNN